MEFSNITTIDVKECILIAILLIVVITCFILIHRLHIMNTQMNYFVQKSIEQDNEELRTFIEQEIDELKQELKKDFPNEKLPD